MKYYSVQVNSNTPISKTIVSKARKETECRMKQNQPVYFLKSIKGNWLEMSVIVTNPYMKLFDEKEDTMAFLSSIGVEDVEPSNIYWYEIGRDLMTHELEDASNKHLVHDANDILWGLGIRYTYNDRRWSERLIEGSANLDVDEMSVVEKELSLIPGTKPFIEEITRIKASEDSSILVHPVHYTIESDSEKTREFIYTTLIKALVEIGRLDSTRCMTFCLRPFGYASGEWEIDISELYHEYVGGTIVLDMTDGDAISYLFDEVETLGRNIAKYKDDVLTILLLPAQSDSIKELLAPYLENIKFISLLRTSMTGIEAREHIVRACKEGGVEVSEQSLSKFNDKEQFPICYIENYIKTEIARATDSRIFNQYKDIADDAFAKHNNVNDKGDAYAIELFDIIGQDELINEVKQIITRIKVEEKLKKRGLKVETGPMNFVFSGNPGVAKTTVAYLLAKELHRQGLLSTDEVVEAGRKNIIGRYEGETSKNVRDAFRKSFGKVLFIDEAYSLVEYWGGKASGYGKEAIDVIVEELGKVCSDRVVIMAGYPKEMEELLDSNPGLRSRMTYHIEFEDYSTSELLDILEYHAHIRGMRLDEGIRDELKPHLDRARKVKNFGNGRFVVNLLDKAIMRQRLRLSKVAEDELTSWTDEEIMRLEKEDFEDVANMTKKLCEKKSDKSVIGFAL